MFGRLLGWYTRPICTRLGALPPYCNSSTDRFKIHFSLKSCVLLYWQIYCTALEQWAISQTLRRGTGNGITKLLLLVIFNRGRHLYFAGGHYVGHRRHSSYGRPMEQGRPLFMAALCNRAGHIYFHPIVCYGRRM